MKCPGQDSRYWTGDVAFETPCPQCGAAVEAFRDEGAVRCRRCGHRFANPGVDFSCAKWCSLAAECLGFAPQRTQTHDTGGALAARLIQWVEKHGSAEPGRVARALRVFQHAKELVRQEGGDPCAVLSAAMLLASSADEPDAASPGEASGLEAARREIGWADETFQRICDIIASHRRGEDPSTNESQTVADSLALADLATASATESATDVESLIQCRFHTETGRLRARQLLSQR